MEAGTTGQGEAVDMEQELQSGAGQQTELVKAVTDTVTEMDSDGEVDSDSVSVADSVSKNTDLYSLKEVNDFLDDSFGRSVEISAYFPDTIKFIQTVSTLQKGCRDRPAG